MDHCLLHFHGLCVFDLGRNKYISGLSGTEWSFAYFDYGISISSGVSAKLKRRFRITSTLLVCRSDFTSQPGELRYIEAVQEGGLNHQTQVPSSGVSANKLASGHSSGVSANSPASGHSCGVSANFMRPYAATSLIGTPSGVPHIDAIFKCSGGFWISSKC